MSPKPTYEELEKENLELKRTIEALQADREKYRAIYDHRFNCLYIHDFEGNFLDANDGALTMLGYKREEITGLNFAAIIEEDHLPQAFEFLQEINRGDYEQRVFEYKLKRKDGSYIWVDTGGSLIHRKDNRRVFLGMARDITARKQAEKDLQRSRNELESLIQARTHQLTAANRRLEQEIEERKLTQEALENSERNYRQLVQSASSIILRLDSQATCMQ